MLIEQMLSLVRMSIRPSVILSGNIKNMTFSVLCSQQSMISDDKKLVDAKQYRVNKIGCDDECDKVRKARLIYQSRKRGILENGILLSTFVDEYFDKLTSKQLSDYDALINIPDNDWDIYCWITGMGPVPDMFKTDVLELLKEHSKNKGMKFRNHQPPLKLKPQ